MDYICDLAECERTKTKAYSISNRMSAVAWIAIKLHRFEKRQVHFTLHTFEQQHLLLKNTKMFTLRHYRLQGCPVFSPFQNTNLHSLCIGTFTEAIRLLRGFNSADVRRLQNCLCHRWIVLLGRRFVSYMLSIASNVCFTVRPRRTQYRITQRCSIRTFAL